MKRSSLSWVICICTVLSATFSRAADTGLGAAPFTSLREILPQKAADFEKLRRADLDAVARALDRNAAERTWSQRHSPPEEVLRWIAVLIDAKRQVDGHLDQILELRGGIAEMPPGKAQQDAARGFLQAASRLIDLSGRLRYSLSDAIDNATFDLAEHPTALDKLLDLLIEKRVNVGASLMTFALFDPDKDSNLDPFPATFKKKVLQLASVTRSVEAMRDVTKYLLEEHPPAELSLVAAETIRAIGLPQNPRPGQDPTLPAPLITASRMARVLADIPRGAFAEELLPRRDALLQWLEIREKEGLTEDSYQVGESEIRAGDWLLMRNPSPYNQFTELAPGLFTHVGVVTVEKGTDGVRRFLIVDLPERGNKMPATNVDIFLQRTLHYVFLRHDDSAVANRMNDVALSLIGNETQFDLQFKTERVAALKGRPLRGELIHTYCAGLLLICAQETGRPRQDFFPVPEAGAGGFCLQNLAKLGMSIGNDFVSPTGAIFSARMKVVGRCEPMYEPTREVQEAIFDHFAFAMVNKNLTPSPSASQALREKVAGISRISPFLSRAMARANRVSEKTDLQSAARAAAVVETLDEIALGNADEFTKAREFFLNQEEPQAPTKSVLRRPAALPSIYQQRHVNLLAKWREGKLTARELRVELVNYYAARGKLQLDERFFREQK